MKEYYSISEMLAGIEIGLLEEGDKFEIEGGNLNGFIATFNDNKLKVNIFGKDVNIGIDELLECKRFKFLNNTIDDIDIQKIEEVPNMRIDDDLTPAVIAFYNTINQLVKAVKKLDKKMMD